MILTAPPSVTTKDYYEMKKLCGPGSLGRLSLVTIFSHLFLRIKCLLFLLDAKEAFESKLREEKTKRFFDNIKRVKPMYNVREWEKDYKKQKFNQQFMSQVKYRRPKDFVDPLLNNTLEKSPSAPERARASQEMGSASEDPQSFANSTAEINPATLDVNSGRAGNKSSALPSSSSTSSHVSRIRAVKKKKGGPGPLKSSKARLRDMENTRQHQEEGDTAVGDIESTSNKPQSYDADDDVGYELDFEEANNLNVQVTDPAALAAAVEAAGPRQQSSRGKRRHEAENSNKSQDQVASKVEDFDYENEGYEDDGFRPIADEEQNTISVVVFNGDDEYSHDGFYDEDENGAVSGKTDVKTDMEEFQEERANSITEQEGDVVVVVVEDDTAYRHEKIHKSSDYAARHHHNQQHDKQPPSSSTKRVRGKEHKGKEHSHEHGLAGHGARNGRSHNNVSNSGAKKKRRERSADADEDSTPKLHHGSNSNSTTTKNITDSSSNGNNSNAVVDSRVSICSLERPVKLVREVVIASVADDPLALKLLNLTLAQHKPSSTVNRGSSSQDLGSSSRSPKNHGSSSGNILVANSNGVQPPQPRVREGLEEQTSYMDACIECFLLHQDSLVIVVESYHTEIPLRAEAEITRDDLNAICDLPADTSNDPNSPLDLDILANIAQEIIENIELRMEYNDAPRILLNLIHEISAEEGVQSSFYGLGNNVGFAGLTGTSGGGGSGPNSPLRPNQQLGASGDSNTSNNAAFNVVHDEDVEAVLLPGTLFTHPCLSFDSQGTYMLFFSIPIRHSRPLRIKLRWTHARPRKCPCAINRQYQ